MYIGVCTVKGALLSVALSTGGALSLQLENEDLADEFITFSPTVSVDKKHSVTVTMNISPSVLATLAVLASSGVWAHKIRGTNSRQLMAPKGYGGAATIFNEGENNQNNIIVGENNTNYAIIREEQGGSPETSPAPSSGTCPVRDLFFVDEEYTACAECVFVSPDDGCECSSDTYDYYCVLEADQLDPGVCVSNCVSTTGEGIVSTLYCCDTDGDSDG